MSGAIDRSLPPIVQPDLFGHPVCSPEHVAALLDREHYLGSTKTALFAWSDRHGAMVFGRPRSRRLPETWLELVRWCLVDGGHGSEQWAAFVRWARRNRPETTIVSYSDPDRGHTGALYRACNWLWAPTWLRLGPPPTGNGNWGGAGRQGVKDRWVFPLLPDEERERLIRVDTESVRNRVPWLSYREPRWKRGRYDPRTGGGNYKLYGRPLVLEGHIEAIRAVLTDDLLKPEFRRMRAEGDDLAKGHCYAAAEALFHLCGGRACGLAVCHGKDEDGITHWWLRSPDGTIHDPTSSQYLSRGKAPPYQVGRAGAFLTSLPSKRAREIMARVQAAKAAAPVLEAAE